MSFLRSFVVVFAIITPVAVFAQSLSAQSLSAQSRADTTFAIARSGVIDITLRSGRLLVRGSERTDAELRANGTNYELRSSGVGVTLTTSGGSRWSSSNRDREERLELIVPRNVRLIISARSADVNVRDVSGDVEIHAVSGDVVLHAIGGRAIVETLSGDLEITDGVGDLRATTMSGDVVAHGIRGTAEVHTTSGSVALGMPHANRVQVESVSGDIMFDGMPSDAANFQLTTHSGDVTLRMPDGARGVLDVSTFSGEITTNSALTLTSGGAARSGRRERSGQHFEFGGGGATLISISTFNGDIRLEHGARRPPE